MQSHYLSTERIKTQHKFDSKLQEIKDKINKEMS